MASPLISVILPVYNREKYIGEAINSLLNQTCQDFEIIVIDDASTDNSLSIIKAYYDFRIKVIENKSNLGVSASRNRGIEISKGSYIAFLDSDDIAFPERLEKQLKILENKSIDICGSWLELFDSRKIIVLPKTHEAILCELLNYCSMCITTVMLRKEVLGDNRFKENLRYGEDYELWARICWAGKFYNLQEPLVRYRVHKEQISVTNKQHQLKFDADIRLKMFKNICYDQNKFLDDLIKKHFLLDEYVDTKEFFSFLRWLEHIESKNFYQPVFPQFEFQKVLKDIREQLVFKLFFKESKIGIDKKWRLQAMRKLKLKENINIVKKKIKSRMKKI